jgi:benzodiazapine receptor
MNTWSEWYKLLNKPTWTPNPGVIGTIWTLLYPIIFISFGYSFVLIYRGKLSPWLLLPFVINIIANVAFTPIFMGQRNLLFASIDILVVLGSIIWIMIAMWPHSRGVAYAQIPYLVWVSIATVTMLSIYWLNR